jgi:hypothetical protein
MTMLALKLGTGPLPEGVYSLYALTDEQGLVDLYEAACDAQALERALGLAAGSPLECEPGLAAAAAPLGLAVRPLEPGEAANRAYLAKVVFAAQLIPECPAGVLMDLWEAAYVLAFAAAKERRQWQLLAEVRGTIGKTRLDERLGLVFNTGEHPSLWVMAEADLRRLAAGSAELEAIERLTLTFEDGPEALAAALEEPYGLTSVPWPRAFRNGVEGPVTPVEAEKLAALMGAAGRHVSAQRLGMDWDPHLGGTLQVRLSVLGVAD